MNFSDLGIRNLSPSSINLWASNPGLWVARYGLKVTDSAGPKAWRGSAVEAGLWAWLQRMDDTEVVRVMSDRFEKDAQGDLSGPVDVERQAMGTYLTRAVEAVQTRPQWLGDRPIMTTQLGVQMVETGLEVPIIGYIDFSGSTWLFDLKTTLACPSEPRDPDVAQVALYHANTAKAPSIVYCTPKRWAIYEPSADHLKQAYHRLVSDAFKLQRMIKIMPNVREMFDALPVRQDDYRMSPTLAQSIAAARAAA